MAQTVKLASDHRTYSTVIALIAHDAKKHDLLRLVRSHLRMFERLLHFLAGRIDELARTP